LLLSYFRAVNGGNATGGADVDDDAVLFEIQGHTAGSGNMISANSTAKKTVTFTNWSTVRCRIGSTLYYIPIAQTIAAST
jgi:uncharacterized membrane protein